jgi:hypothetical protein
MRGTLFSLISIVAAIPTSLIARQDATDYGFWNATIYYNGGSFGETRDITAWYYREELSATTKCQWSDIHGVTNSQCTDDQGNILPASSFSYSLGAISKYPYRSAHKF